MLCRPIVVIDADGPALSTLSSSRLAFTAQIQFTSGQTILNAGCIPTAGGHRAVRVTRIGHRERNPKSRAVRVGLLPSHCAVWRLRQIKWLFLRRRKPLYFVGCISQAVYSTDGTWRVSRDSMDYRVLLLSRRIKHNAIGEWSFPLKWLEVDPRSEICVGTFWSSTNSQIQHDHLSNFGQISPSLLWISNNHQIGWWPFWPINWFKSKHNHLSRLS